MKKEGNNTYFFLFILICIFILKNSFVNSQPFLKEWISISGVGNGDAENPQNWDPNGVPTIESNVVVDGITYDNLTINDPISMYALTNNFGYIKVKGPLTCKDIIFNYYGEFVIYNNITALIYNNTYITEIRGPTYFNATVENFGAFSLYYGVIFYKDVINRYDFYNNVIAPLAFYSSFFTSDPGSLTFLIQLDDFYIYGNFWVINQAKLEFYSIKKLEIHGFTVFNGDSIIDIQHSTLVSYNYVELSEGANFTLTDSVMYFLLNDTHGLLMYNSLGSSNEFNVIDSQLILSNYFFNIKYNSVINLSKKSLLTAFNSYIRLAENSKLLVFNSSIVSNDTKLTMSGSSLLQIDESYYVVGISDLSVQTFCILLDKSKIEIINNSTFAIEGPIDLRDNSSILVNNSNLIIQDADFYTKHFSYVSIENSIFQMRGNLFMTNSSILDIKNSTLYVFGYFGAFTNTSFHSDNSSINIGNYVIMSTNAPITFNNTVLNIFSDGSFFCEAPNLFIENSLVAIRNYYYSFGSFSSINSTFIVYRTMEIKGNFFGENLEITVVTGNLTIKENSTFVCNFCNILIEMGQFITLENTSITLKGTTMKNGGKVISGGQIHLSPGSTIKNDNEFILSSDILSDNNNNNNNDDNDDKNDELQSLQNQGSFKFINDSKVQVEMNSSGKLIIGKNQVEIEKFKQEIGGLFSMEKGGSMFSKSIIQFQGGSIIGNGSFIGNVSNSAATIGDSNTSIINKFKISGNYKHDSNATIIFNVENENDFSFIEILNEFYINGGLVEIKINIEFLQTILKQYSNNNFTSKIDLISFNTLIDGSSSSDSSTTPTPTTNQNNKNTLGLDKIIFKSYDKSSNTEKVLSNDCISTSSSSSKFSLLLRSCTPSDGGDGDGDNNESKPITSKAWVAGPIIGAVAIAAVAVTLYVKKERISIFLKLKKISVGTKLKSITSKK
ncbi:hypothetical protein DDB_G0283833 [Dictyostelium discoideum AX4]|uniref:Transmembrane protein n=1 Tax=Dictyostelium discoideum TaxID=44689 RepID=Q54QH1_DICDI|nr:hypothetical protein DDB_G0283833 [Dictyostelium discoideum AX4]EAL65531.1 hypothetical protein DDB_G0283833 [Dictyostelium discoideum AX4]|eukprot:XP_638900.1 hypothetical protein DDB_G0283833 [Dictyostelium discoideum AX4]